MTSSFKKSTDQIIKNFIIDYENKLDKTPLKNMTN